MPANIIKLKVEILLFGRLTEIVGHSSIQLEDVTDTNAVSSQLAAQYPALKQLNYKIAVDQQIIHGNQVLADGMTVAVMPPFSGG